MRGSGSSRIFAEKRFRSLSPTPGRTPASSTTARPGIAGSIRPLLRHAQRVPVQGSRRSCRLCARVDWRPHRTGQVAAKAARRRHATGGSAGCCRSLRVGSPPARAGHGPRPRPTTCGSTRRTGSEHEHRGRPRHRPVRSGGRGSGAGRAPELGEPDKRATLVAHRDLDDAAIDRAIEVLTEVLSAVAR